MFFIYSSLALNDSLSQVNSSMVLARALINSKHSDRPRKNVNPKPDLAARTKRSQPRKIGQLSFAFVLHNRRLKSLQLSWNSQPRYPIEYLRVPAILQII